MSLYAVLQSATIRLRTRGCRLAINFSVIATNPDHIMDATFVREKTEVEMLKLGLLGGIWEKSKWNSRRTRYAKPYKQSSKICWKTDDWFSIRTHPIETSEALDPRYVFKHFAVAISPRFWSKRRQIMESVVNLQRSSGEPLVAVTGNPNKTGVWGRNSRKLTSVVYVMANVVSCSFCAYMLTTFRAFWP